MSLPLFRDAVRLIRRNPVLSLVAIVSLAVGITINATAFSIIDGLVLRPLPIADPGHLVGIRTTSLTGSTAGLSYDDLRDLQRSTRRLSAVAAVETAGAAVDRGNGTPEIVTLGVASTNYFSVLGVEAAQGRVFIDSDRDVSRGNPAVVISDRYWRTRLGSDPSVIGRTIRLNTNAWTIVGVLPERFGGTQPIIPPAVWIPTEAAIALGRPTGGRTERRYATFGRLAPGVTLAQAAAEVQAIGDGLAREHADTNHDTRLTAEFETAARFKNLWLAVILSIAVVSLPLLIACANVMGLLLGRAEERRKEMAIRLALGGSRARLVRQLLAETTLLSLLAVAASLLLSLWILRVIPSVLPPLPVELNLDLRIDWRIGLATLAVALGATLLAGLAPALLASRTDLTPIIKGQAASAATFGRRRITLRNALVTGQIAVMFLMLELAALFTTSLLNANRTDPGFAPGAMTFATIAPGAAGYSRARSDEFYAQLIERMRRQPDVDAAAYTRHVPLNSLYGGGGTESVRIAGHEPPRGDAAFHIRNNVVSAGYFDTMGIRLLRGRDFDDRERAGGECAVIVNDTMARTYWPNDSPIGRRIDLLPSAMSPRPAPQSCAIVGVVADSKYLTLRETTPPYLFLPMTQRSIGEVTLVVRGHGDERALASSVRQAIAAIDPALPAIDILTRTEHLKRALFAERTLAGSVTGLGAISLLLAMVGVYGVVAFAVSRRTRDIGIEMALGASARQVMRSVLSHGARLTMIGVGIGAAIGVGVSYVIADSLYGVSATDPRMFLASAAITLPVALAASFLPARRASRIDPIVALRE